MIMFFMGVSSAGVLSVKSCHGDNRRVRDRVSANWDSDRSYLIDKEDERSYTKNDLEQRK